MMILCAPLKQLVLDNSIDRILDQMVSWYTLLPFLCSFSSNCAVVFSMCALSEIDCIPDLSKAMALLPQKTNWSSRQEKDENLRTESKGEKRRKKNTSAREGNKPDGKL
ncbi:unnamed protein product [Caretta caretta]